MALACTTSDDEIHTILALAEIAERKGEWSAAAAGLTGAIKHYGAVKFGLPAVMAGDTEALRARVGDQATGGHTAGLSAATS